MEVFLIMENINNKIHLDGDTYTINFMKCYKGKRIHIYKKGFLTYEEAAKAIDDLVAARIAKVEMKISPQFDCFFQQYCEYRSLKISKSSMLTLDSLKTTYLSELYNMDISKAFSTPVILKWYSGIVNKDNICTKWKNRIFGEMRFMADFAFKMKYISSDNCLEAKGILENIKISNKRKEKSFYTPKQLKKFLSVIEDEDDKDMFTTFAYLGARLSEFIGLTWDCYNEKTKSIEIKQQIMYLKEGKPVLIDTLKTKESYRICKLNNEVDEIMKKRKRRCDKGYIFPKSLKEYKTPTSKTAFRHKMNKYMDIANLPYISAHGFRHTKATMLMSVCLSMMDIKSAARFLGHSVTMMMETYAHEDKKNTDNIIKRLEKII